MTKTNIPKESLITIDFPDAKNRTGYDRIEITAYLMAGGMPAYKAMKVAGYSESYSDKQVQRMRRHPRVQEIIQAAVTGKYCSKEEIILRDLIHNNSWLSKKLFSNTRM